VGDGDAVRAPALLDRYEPVLDLILEGVQTEVEMLGLALFRGGAVELATGVDQPTGRLGLLVSRGIQIWLEGIKEIAAGVALAKSISNQGLGRLIEGNQTWSPRAPLSWQRLHSPST
jgi:hypothetical protein